MAMLKNIAATCTIACVLTFQATDTSAKVEPMVVDGPGFGPVVPPHH